MADSLPNQQANFIVGELLQLHLATISSAVVAAKGFAAFPQPNRGYVCTALL